MLKAKASQALNARLPEWTHSLSNRTKLALLQNERLDNLEMETVRAFGEQHWLAQPHVGRKSVAELARRLGGWRWPWARCPWPHRSWP